MNIFSLDLNLIQYAPAKIQHIDLDNVTSIGPISVRNYTGFDIGESHAGYQVHLMLGRPIYIMYSSGTCLSFPEDLLVSVISEQEKLIYAWTNKDKNKPKNIEDVLRDLQMGITPPVSDFQKGRIQGIRDSLNFLDSLLLTESSNNG